ncbi:MAG TPA: DUF1688 family protein [Steroidobacteraceae bacterium]|nr:DUF1688 family protein [Steroidobacteraceae bacterium]
MAESARTLLRADAVRKSAHRMLMLALEGRLAEWTVDLDRLAPTADFVAGVVRERYPRLDVPVHARWRHFVFGGRDLWEEIVAKANWESTEAAARSAFDLVITSVLLDAGAGAGWNYHDRAGGLVAARSEGLALASLRWYESGGLADNPSGSFRVDAAALRRVDSQAIQNAFQAGEANPLLGLEGRAALLNRLGAVMESRPDLFAISDSPRPGGLFDALRARASNGRLPAGTILETLLEALGPIWQGRPSLGGVPLGDCWLHPALAADRPEDSYAPLHKLSQWLTYSLLEPLGKAGISVFNVHELTGLAEYRNGGLFVDMGVLNPRERQSLSKTHAVMDPFVVGWRTLTVALLDRLAPLVGTRLGLTPEQFPLACVLEGGTWAAGRLIARKTRADGGPPFHVFSDGTVF